MTSAIHVGRGALVWLGLCWALLATAAPETLSGFTLQDFLGRAWSHESVRFTASLAQIRKAKAGEALVSEGGVSVPYQIVSSETPAIEILTDLEPFETKRFEFRRGQAKPATDLTVDDTPELIRIVNGRIAIAVRKSLVGRQGPIAGVRLGSGRWIGDSMLASPRRVAAYSARVVARGPVFAEVRCDVEFAEGGTWQLRIRLQALEPAIVVEESFSLGDATTFSLVLNREFEPHYVLHRRGRGTAANANAVGEVMKSDLRVRDAQPPFMLEPWLHWWERDRQGNWFGLYNDSDDDLLAIGALEPGLWVDPGVPAESRSPSLLPLQYRGNDLSLEFPLRGGKRKWLIAALGRRETLAPLDAATKQIAPLPQLYVIKHGDFPLTRIKDYALKWTAGEVIHPRLFVTGDEVARLRASFKAVPATVARLAGTAISPYSMDEPIALYLASGSPELGARLASTATQWVQDAVSRLLRQEDLVTMGFAPHHQWNIFAAMSLADAVWSSGHVSPTARERLAAQTAFLAYTMSRPDYWSPERGYAANPNMTTTVATLQVVLACMIPTHPLARAWVDEGMRELKDRQLDTWSDAHGGWLEAPHYAMVSFDHLVGAFLAARNAGFVDHLHNPRMKRVAEWLAKISTPPDSAAGGTRHLPPIGNTYVREPTGEFALMAHLWKEVDPEFASAMQWMHRQQGSPRTPGIGGFFATLAGYRQILADDSIPARAPAYGSERFAETGVMLRSGFPTNRETQLHLIAGANHSHYDRDSGSFTLWGKGRVVSDDFGYSGHAPGAEHSMVVSPRAPDGAIMRVEQFINSDGVDYVRGIKSGAWERQVVFVKDADPLGPNFFVIHDASRNDPGARMTQWFTAASVRIKGRAAWVAGNDDVDTDVLFLPESGDPPTLAEKSVASWGMAEGKYGRVTTTQTAIVLPLDATLGLTTVLYPRLKRERRPALTELAGGRGVRIESEAGTDYVFLATEPFEYGEGPVSFKGSVGTVRIRGSTAKLWLGAPGSVAALGEKLRIP